MSYKLMGPDRSLAKLLELWTAAGLKISENTLKTYSVKFEWQRRLLEEQSKLPEMHEQQDGKIGDQMNQQDATMTQGLKAMVFGSLRYYQDRMKKTAEYRKNRGESANQMLDLSPLELAALSRTAQQTERLARGQATSRTEIWVDIASTVVREFVIIFMATNKLKDETERENEFLRLGDDMMKRYYSNTVRQGVSIAEKSKG